MAGLVPAIHVGPRVLLKDVDARDKPGHDERRGSAVPPSKVTDSLNPSGITVPGITVPVHSIQQLDGFIQDAADFAAIAYSEMARHGR
jgi:hypothetical protein